MDSCASLRQLERRRAPGPARRPGGPGRRGGRPGPAARRGRSRAGRPRRPSRGPARTGRGSSRGRAAPWPPTGSSASVTVVERALDVVARLPGERPAQHRAVADERRPDAGRDGQPLVRVDDPRVAPARPRRNGRPAAGRAGRRARRHRRRAARRRAASAMSASAAMSSIAPVLVVPATATTATGTTPAATSASTACRSASTSTRCWSSTGTSATAVRPEAEDAGRLEHAVVHLDAAVDPARRQVRAGRRAPGRARCARTPCWRAAPSASRLATEPLLEKTPWMPAGRSHASASQRSATSSRRLPVWPR